MIIHNKFGLEIGSEVMLDAKYRNGSKVRILNFTPNQMFALVESTEIEGNFWETMTNRLTPIIVPNENKKNSLSIVACLDLRGGIGNENNDLLFHIKEDIEMFKALTINKTVVMGRKTAESLPGKKPLVDRRNIVLTRHFRNKEIPGFEMSCNYYDILILSKTDDVIIIGGAEIYRLFLPFVNTMYLTIVNKTMLTATKFFPIYSLNDWNREEKKITNFPDGMLSHGFYVYKRKNTNN